MIKVQSRRAQGAVVTVVKNGKEIPKRITGMGSTFSELVTADMRLQRELEFISYGGKSELPPKVTEAPATQPEGSGDTTPTPPTTPSPPAKVQFYTAKEIKKFRKDELQALIKNHKLDVDTDQNVRALRKAINEYNIPKE